MADLVTNLHPRHIDPFCLHPLQYVDRELMEAFAHLRQCQPLPGVGQKLLLGIRPPVAVVKIEHDPQARLMGTPGQHNHLFWPVETQGTGLI